jgi:hypothetical protein
MIQVKPIKSFKALFLTCLLASGMLNANPLHDVHRTLCQIRYNTEAKAFEVSLQLDVEDLEAVLRKDDQGGSLQIGTEFEATGAEEKMLKYVQQKLGITINHEELPLNYLGKELDDDLHSLWLHFESEPMDKPQSIGVFNKLLVENNTDQINIVQIWVDNEQLGYVQFDSERYQSRVTFP